MEVGKLILNVVKNKASMTLSVKPFGCMPSSSVSDGVQSLITERYPGTIFCAVETSGDGAVNFQSRVQMYLFKARKVAELELEDALKTQGITMDQVHAFLDAHPRFKNALHRSPFSSGSTPVDLVNEVAYYINTTPAERFSAQTASVVRGAAEWTKAFVFGAPTKAQKTIELGREFAEELKGIARDHGPTLVKKGVEQARARVEKLPLVSQAKSLFDKAS